jgi:hypothetical protein
VINCFPFTGKGAENQGSETMRKKKKRGDQDQAKSGRVDGPTLFFGWRLTVGMGCLMAILACLGCDAMRVHKMQRHTDRGDDTWLAAQTIDCHTRSRACARLHLLKGKACLRLAESEKTPAVHFACAADELEWGIALMSAWEDTNEPLEMHMRYCDALDGLQALQSEPEASATRNRLLEAAQALYQLAPGSIPAEYYFSMAWLRQLEPRLATISAANRFAVCSRLKQTVNRVLSRMQTAKEKQSPQWRRFAERYQRLAFDLGAAMHTAECQ